MTRRMQFGCEISDTLLPSEVKIRQSIHRESRLLHETVKVGMPIWTFNFETVVTHIIP